MAEDRWLRHALAVGRFEFRRSIRNAARSKRQLVGFALGVGLPTLALAGVWLLLSGEVSTWRPEGMIPVPDAVVLYVGGFWSFGLLIVAQRTASLRPRIDGEPLVLSTVSARTAAVGLWVAEVFRFAAYVAPPLAVLALVTLDLFGTPGVLVTLPLATLLFVSSVVTVGALVGYLVVLALSRVPVLARYKRWLSGVGLVVGVAGYLAAQYLVPGEVWVTVFERIPLLWVVDVATLGTSLESDAVRALAAVASTLVVVAVGTVWIERVTERLWFTDPVSPEGSEAASEASPSVPPDESGWLDSAVADGSGLLPVPSVGSRPTTRTAEMTVLHTRRNPRRLTVFFVPILVFAVSFLGSGGVTGVSRTVLVGVAVVLPWLAGALFALNPLGDQQSVLPVTLSAAPPRAFVRGTMLPGLAFGLPVVVAVTVAAGLLSPSSVVEVGALTVLAVYLLLVSVAVCPAVGIYLPRFSAVSVGQADDVLPPRTAAMLASLLLVAGPGAVLTSLVVAPATARVVAAGLLGYLPAFLLELVGGALSLPVGGIVSGFVGVAEAVRGVDLPLFRYGAGTLLVAGGVATAVLAYRRAVRWVAGYTLP